MRELANGGACPAVLEKGKPAARRGRKASGLRRTETAGPPKGDLK